MMTIEDYIKKCTYFIELFVNNKSEGYMTGFLIEKNTILTTMHSNIDRKELEVLHKQGYVKYEITVDFASSSKIETNNIKYIYDYDCAILNVPLDNKHYLPLDTMSLTRGDELISYSFSSEDRDILSEEKKIDVIGRDVPLVFEGYRTNHASIQFKDSTILQGFSGSPVVSKKTNGVVGFITISRKTNLGGFGVKLSNINEITELVKDNINYCCEEWMSITNNQQHSYIGVNGYGLSNPSKKFFTLCNDDLLLKDMYVEPNYCVMKDNDGNGFIEDYLDNVSFSEKAISLLNKNDYLVITGAYGTGKTIATKYLVSLLKDKNNFVYYYNSNDLIKYYKEIDFNIISKERKIYLIIDGLDEIFMSNSEDNDVPIEFLEYIMNIIREKNNIITLINCRDIEVIHQGRSNLTCKLFESISYENNGYNFEDASLIKIKYFEKKHTQIWLDNYTKIYNQNSENVKNELKYKDIKDNNKKFLSACSNPIFLYMFTNYYFSNSFSCGDFSNIHLYSIYRDFVSRTYKGKYIEKRGSGHNLLNSYPDYRNYLSDVANDIFMSKKIKVSDFITQYSDDLLMDMNDESHEIILDVTKNSEEGLNLLNCYFFSYVDNGKNQSVRFNDNNVLYFFIAEKYYMTIKNMILSYVTQTKKLDQIYDDFLEINCKLVHPIVCDMLIDSLHELNKDEISKLSEIAYMFIEEGYAINILSESKFFTNFDIKKVNTDILLSIIIINLETTNKSNEKYFCKRLDWYVNAAKKVDWDYFNLVRRHYKKINLNQTHLKRLNYKGYNFNEAKLNEVKFIQSKLVDTTFKGAIFNKTKFILCSIRLDLKEITGSIEFINCKIEDLVITNCKHDNGLFIKFSRCEIKNLKIDESRNVLVKISNSELSSGQIKSTSTLTMDISLTNIAKLTVFSCSGRLNMFRNYDSSGKFVDNCEKIIFKPNSKNILLTNMSSDKTTDYWNESRNIYNTTI